MHIDLSQAPFTLISTCSDTIYGATVLHLGDGETTRSIVFGGNEVEGFDALGVFTFADEEFGSLLETDDGDAENRHYKNQGSRSVPYVAPTLVVRLCTGARRGIEGWVCAAKIWKEGPGKKASYELTNA